MYTWRMQYTWVYYLTDAQPPSSCSCIHQIPNEKKLPCLSFDILWLNQPDLEEILNQLVASPDVFFIFHKVQGV